MWCECVCVFVCMRESKSECVCERVSVCGVCERE